MEKTQVLKKIKAPKRHADSCPHTRVPAKDSKSKTTKKRTSKGKHPDFQSSTVEKWEQKSIVRKLLMERYFRQGDERLIRAVAEELVDWAETFEKERTLEKYLTKRRIPYQSYYKWCNKYDFLKEANDFANMIFGVRREEGLIDKLSDKYVGSTLHHYLPRCKESDAYHAALKASADANANLNLKGAIDEGLEKLMKEQKCNGNTGTKS